MNTLYVSDLDGTLLNSNTELSEKTIEIINMLVKKGMKFTYATARSFTSAAKVTKGLQLDMPIITYNGAFFVEPDYGEVIHSVGFSAEQIKYVSTTLMKNNVYPLVYSMIDGRECVSWMPGKENEGIISYLRAREGDKRLRRAEMENDLYKGDVFYFTVIDEKENIEYIKDYFNDKAQYVYTFQRELYGAGEYWLEIMPRDATKAMGIKRLKEISGCDKIVCFGDAINDISMFNIADAAYAVENANPELKKLATGVIASNDEDGVARWLLEHVK